MTSGAPSRLPLMSEDETTINDLEPLESQEVEADTDEISGPPADDREPAARTLKRLGVDALGFPIGS